MTPYAHGSAVPRKSRPSRSRLPARGPASSDRTKVALIAAGTELFARHGFDGARSDQIARRARVNKALINYHFGGKQGLYDAILDETFTEVAGQIRALDAWDGNSDEKLRRFAEIFAGINIRRPAFSVILLREVVTGGRHLGEAVFPHFAAFFGQVRKITAQGMKDGEFREVDPFLTHLSLVGSLAFFFATVPFRARLTAEGKIPVAAPKPEDFVKHMQELMSRGLAAGSPPLPGAKRSRTQRAWKRASNPAWKRNRS